MSCCDTTTGTLRADQVAQWIREVWIPQHPEHGLRMQWINPTPFDNMTINKIAPELVFEGHRFVGMSDADCPIVHPIDSRDYANMLGSQIGAFLFHFVPVDGTTSITILGIHFRYGNYSYETAAIAAVPAAHTALWTAFNNECNRLAYVHEDRVIVIGGNQDSFVPTVQWSEIVLPAELKRDILDDVRGFYDKGVDIYRRLNLKPFRKLLFAGVPGTGKTMMCMGLAKWALERKYRVIYVSSGQRRQGDESGSHFDKVQYALQIASEADTPSLIILEELDAFLHKEEKALILNVLDGSESIISAHGTLLISTTNYPEAIDERVLKRPGRLDRIFIVPPPRTLTDAGAMLKRYLGTTWDESHETLIPHLIGCSGAFIREVAIDALTQIASAEMDALPLGILTASYERLKAQLDARDAFIEAQPLPAQL